VEWKQLSESRDVLRIWSNSEIKSVAEDYFDDYIIDTARKLQVERNNNDFIKAGRLIGTVLEHLNQLVGDFYLEYRLRHLIGSGVFLVEGPLEAMRSYSVRLKY
jgi:hypothetical protein